MHLNPLYDRKTDLGQPTQFRKKIWKLRCCAHRIHFFLLIPNIVSKNHRMHLNPLYDRKTDLGQPTQFRKENFHQFFHRSINSSKILKNIKLIIFNRPRIVSLTFSRKFEFWLVYTLMIGHFRRMHPRMFVLVFNSFELSSSQITLLRFQWLWTLFNCLDRTQIVKSTLI